MFRKGTLLLGPEEMEGDYDSEELRREVSFSAQCSVTSMRLIGVGHLSCWMPWLNVRRRGQYTLTTSALSLLQTCLRCLRHPRSRSRRRGLTYAVHAPLRRLSARRTLWRNHSPWTRPTLCAPAALRRLRLHRPRCRSRLSSVGDCRQPHSTRKSRESQRSRRSRKS